MAFTNNNTCRSFNVGVNASTWTQLSSIECSEAIIVNKTSDQVNINIEDTDDSFKNFLLDDNDSFTFRGITNCDQISAKSVFSSGSIYVRTQFYGSLMQR